MIIEELSARKKKLEDYVKKHESSVRDDRFRMIHNKGTNQYYVKKSGQNKWNYIKKNNVDDIRKLAQNEYNFKLVNLAKEEIRCIDKFLEKSKYNSILHLSEEFYNFGISDLAVYDIDDFMYVQNWMAEKYETKGFAEDAPEYFSASGVRVRSKSEAEIYNCLTDCKIPFKYECPIIINGIRIYPDFTTLDVKRRKVIYWEHLGMMEDREYSRDAIGRINLMQKGGITVGDNLIVTFENALNPLNRRSVMQLIKQAYEI